MIVSGLKSEPSDADPDELRAVPCAGKGWIATTQNAPEFRLERLYLKFSYFRTLFHVNSS
jgi:hypothetical protein